MSINTNIVIYFAHLNIERSVINQSLCDAVRDLPYVNFRDLHELYPNFFIDTKTEQSILRAADLIVFQHPIYWYSAPAIIKHFLDSVFLNGFAYGNGGNALQGKDFLLVASTGAAEDQYQRDGVHYYNFSEMIRPIEQTARFCGMQFLTPLVLHGGQSLSKEKINTHAAVYRRMLEEYKPKYS
jgi:putative NADPH-quinone reductase